MQTAKQREVVEALRATAARHATWRASHAELAAREATTGEAVAAVAKALAKIREEIAALNAQDAKMEEDKRHAMMSYNKCREAVQRETLAQTDAAATLVRAGAARRGEWQRRPFFLPPPLPHRLCRSA